MDQESESRRGRKPSTPNLDRVVEAITRGDYDGRMSAIQEAINERNEIREEAVMAQVREVFGEDAKVVKTNPFIERAERKKPLERLFEKTDTPENGNTDTDSESSPEEVDVPALAHLDAVEAKMVSEGPLDIERRGAAISGLHSSDIAD